MPLRIKHFAIPVSIVAGVGAALITSAVAQSGGQRADLDTPPPLTAPGAVVPLAATLSAMDEVPPTTSTAEASALITADTTANQVCVNLSATDLAPFSGFHIHKDSAAGTIVVNFAPPPNTVAPFSTCATADPAVVQDIAVHPENYHINVHTAAFPNGEISGALTFRAIFTQDAQETQLLGAPVRVYDTRFNPLGKFTPNTTRKIDLTKSTENTPSGIPIAARAAIVTVTVTRAESAGFLTVYSNAVPVAPNTSNVNFDFGRDVANNITVAMDGAGMIKITSGSTGNEDVVVDVVGYLI